MDVPEGWRSVTLVDVVTDLRGGVSVRSDNRMRNADEPAVLKTSAVTNGVFRADENKLIAQEDLQRAKEEVRAGHIVFSRMNTQDLVGASAYVDRAYPNLFLPDRLWQFSAIDQVADTRWLSLLLASPMMRQEISDSASGTSASMKNISKSKLMALRVDLPPLAEQRKIAAILSSVDEAIEKTQALIDQVQVVKKGLMQELLTRGLPGRHKKFKQTEIGEIPESWEVMEVGQVFDVQLGKMVSPKAQSGRHTRPYLRNINVYWDRLNLDDIAEMDFDEREREKYRLQPGDLLACEGRFVGRCAIWDGVVPEMYYQKALHRIRATGPTTTGFMKM